MPTAPKRFRRPPSTATTMPQPADDHHHLYGRKRWLRLSRRFRRQHPLCARCSNAGKVVAAEVVDHVRPHKGDEELFWDESNLQALCKKCHDRKTATEDGGFGRPTTEPGTVHEV